MTAHIPTPEQFLSFPSDPDEDVDDLDPIADLERRVATLEALAADSVPGTLYDQAIADGNADHGDAIRVEAELTRLQERVMDKQALIDEVLAAVKPSTSKLANKIREILAPQTPSPAPDASPSEPPAPPASPAADEGDRHGQASAGEGSSQVVLGQVGEHPPAHDADVEEWRAYARQRGVYVTGLDTMNRSQIRTMLGIEQPVGT